MTTQRFGEHGREYYSAKDNTTVETTNQGATITVIPDPNLIITNDTVINTKLDTIDVEIIQKTNDGKVTIIKSTEKSIDGRIVYDSGRVVQTDNTCNVDNNVESVQYDGRLVITQLKETKTSQGVTIDNR